MNYYASCETVLSSSSHSDRWEVVRDGSWEFYFKCRFGGHPIDWSKSNCIICILTQTLICLSQRSLGNSSEISCLNLDRSCELGELQAG